MAHTRVGTQARASERNGADSQSSVALPASQAAQSFRTILTESDGTKAAEALQPLVALIDHTWAADRSIAQGFAPEEPPHPPCQRTPGLDAARLRLVASPRGLTPPQAPRAGRRSVGPASEPPYLGRRAVTDVAGWPR